MTIKIYLDEDAQDGDFVTSLRFRGIDVLTSNEAEMNGKSDSEQLGGGWCCGRDRRG